MSSLIESAINVCDLKGVNALRMSYLYGGGKAKTTKVPPLEIFVNNNYKNYEIPKLSLE